MDEQVPTLFFPPPHQLIIVLRRFPSPRARWMWGSSHDGLGSSWEGWRERGTSQAWPSVGPEPQRWMTAEGGLCLPGTQEAPGHLAGSLLLLVHPSGPQQPPPATPCTPAGGPWILL